VEDAARVCAALAGTTSEEGIVVDRTTYGQHGRCSLIKSSRRALGGTAVLGLSSIMRLARGVEIIAQGQVVYGIKCNVTVLLSTDQERHFPMDSTVPTVALDELAY
jgi:hypothetical protein